MKTTKTTASGIESTVSVVKQKTGRPEGYTVLEETKEKISKAMKNIKKTQEHKDSIAKSMIGNTNRKGKTTRIQKTIVDDMYDEYVKDYSDENIGRWIHEHAEELLHSNILSEQDLNYPAQGKEKNSIDMDTIPSTDIFGMNPEDLLLLKDGIGEYYE